MDSNKIGPEGARVLAEGLKENETLTNLHLSHCEIMEEGAVSLATALTNKKNLLVLDLNGNKIMPGGCSAICKAIQTHTTLRELFMSNNLIGPDGAKHLAKVLLNKKYITELCLSMNGIFAEGAIASVQRQRSLHRRTRLVADPQSRIADVHRRVVLSAVAARDDARQSAARPREGIHRVVHLGRGDLVWVGRTEPSVHRRRRLPERARVG